MPSGPDVPARSPHKLALLAGVVAGALILGYLIGDGQEKWVAVLVALAATAVLASSREAFLGFAFAVVILVPTDWISGALVGVPAARLPRILVALALIHVARALYDGTARTAFARWTLVDSAVLAYLVIGSMGMGSLTREIVYVWEQVVVGPVALYCVGRTIGAQRGLSKTASGTIVIAGALLALSVLFDGASGYAHFSHAGADYGWSESVSSVFRPGGTIGQPVRAATLSTLCLAWLPLWFITFRRQRSGLILVAVMLLTAVALSFTRAAWLSAALIVLMYIGVLRGWKSAAFVSAAVLGTAAWMVSAYANSREFFMAVLRPDTIAYRLRLWNYAGQAAERRTLWQLVAGAGILSSRNPNASAAYSLALSGTHNAYLTALLEHGVLGLVAYVGVVAGPAFVGARALKHGVEPGVRAAGMALVGLSLTAVVCGWSSELIRQYNVPAMFLLSVGLLISVVLQPEVAEA